MFQIILHELDTPIEHPTDPDSRTVFIRRWNPAEMTLDSFRELTINRKHNKCKFHCSSLYNNFVFLSLLQLKTK